MPLPVFVINWGLAVCYCMPVGEAFRLPFVETKPFWREGIPLPYKMHPTDKSKFEKNSSPFWLGFEYEGGEISEDEGGGGAACGGGERAGEDTEKTLFIYRLADSL